MFDHKGGLGSTLTVSLIIRYPHFYPFPKSFTDIWHRTGISGSKYKQCFFLTNIAWPHNISIIEASSAFLPHVLISALSWIFEYALVEFNICLSFPLPTYWHSCSVWYSAFWLSLITTLPRSTSQKSEFMLCNAGFTGNKNARTETIQIVEIVKENICVLSLFLKYSQFRSALLHIVRRNMLDTQSKSPENPINCGIGHWQLSHFALWEACWMLLTHLLNMPILKCVFNLKCAFNKKSRQPGVGNYFAPTCWYNCHRGLWFLNKLISNTIYLVTGSF